MAFPVVAIAAIPTQGLRSPVGEWARAAVAEVLVGTVESLSGSLEVVRRRKHVLAKGDVSVVARVACDRCGEPIPLSLILPFATVYSPITLVPAHGEDDDGGPLVPEEFSGEAEDVGEYEGDTIDLAQVVAETCAVERPARYVCGDASATLDAACQARWQPANDPGQESPLAVLQQLKMSH